jgi:hypothetical protein
VPQLDQIYLNIAQLDNQLWLSSGERGSGPRDEMDSVYYAAPADVDKGGIETSLDAVATPFDWGKGGGEGVGTAFSFLVAGPEQPHVLQVAAAPSSFAHTLARGDAGMPNGQAQVSISEGLRIGGGESPGAQRTISSAFAFLGGMDSGEGGGTLGSYVSPHAEVLPTSAFGFLTSDAFVSNIHQTNSSLHQVSSAFSFIGGMDDGGGSAGAAGGCAAAHDESGMGLSSAFPFIEVDPGDNKRVAGGDNSQKTQSAFSFLE